MRAATASYRRTLIASSVAGVVVIAAACAGQTLASGLLPARVALVVFILGSIVGLLLMLVALGSLLVMYRHARRERGEPDLFLAANSARSEFALLGRNASSRAVPLSTLRRWLGAPVFVVGDTVRILSLGEIAATLDSRGCLDGLPFMQEMAKFCGTAGTVFRCVDKVYDYGGKKDLRRLRDTVLVAGQRCDGSAHDGCQAGCYMLWKTAWLARADAPAAPAVEHSDGHGVAPSVRTDMSFGRTSIEAAGVPDRRYMCQFTEIVNSSTEMNPRDPRQDLRPFIAGNLTTMAFGVAMLTRLFNAVQRLRGGTGYPLTKASSGNTSQPADLGLQPGEVVRIASPEKIFETLNRTGKNRGLWFDRDMLKHCGQRYGVLRRVDKIIDDASSRMLRMKIPCIILDAVDNSGEYLRFCAQHDYPYWREAWLERMENKRPSVASAPDGTSESALQRK